MLIAILFASTPAVAEPAWGIEDSQERFDAEQKAQQKALRNKVYGDSDGIKYTFCAAFTRGLTLGLSTIIGRHLGSEDFPMFDEAREINPRAAVAGTIMGVIFLALFAYPALARALSHLRAARYRRLYRRRFMPTIKQPVRPDRPAKPAGPEAPDAPDDSDLPDGIVGSFITRDGYEFVVIRESRKLDDTIN